MAEQTRPSEAGGQEGDAALQISLHPLVVINMSDHFTRFRAQSQSGEAHVPRVFGAVLGEQSGRKVELGNSFEMKVTGGGTTALAIAIDYLKQRLEQYKKTFPKYEMLGWYSTASALEPSDLMLHTTLTEAISESLLYCTLDPQGLLTAGKEVRLPPAPSSPCRPSPEWRTRRGRRSACWMQRPQARDRRCQRQRREGKSWQSPSVERGRDWLDSLSD